MNERIEEKRIEIATQYYASFHSSALKWWQSPPKIIYKNTADLCRETGYRRNPKEPAVIKNSKSKAMFSIAFFLLSMVVLTWKTGDSLYAAIIVPVIDGFLLFAVWQEVKKLADRTPRLVISPAGIQPWNHSHPIPWSHFVDAWFRVDTNGDTAKWELLIHYEDPNTLNFYCESCDPGDWDADPEWIAVCIEVFRNGF